MKAAAIMVLCLSLVSACTDALIPKGFRMMDAAPWVAEGLQ